MWWHTLGLPTSTTTHNSRILDVTIIKYPPQATLSDTYLKSSIVNIFRNYFTFIYITEDVSSCWRQHSWYQYSRNVFVETLLLSLLSSKLLRKMTRKWLLEKWLFLLLKLLLLSCFHLYHLLPVVEYRRGNLFLLKNLVIIQVIWLEKSLLTCN